MSAQAIQELRKYTSCDAADALVKLGEPHGGFLPGVSMYSPQRQAGEGVVVGPVYTVEYALKNDPRPKLDGHYVRGAVGAVINGRVRDLNEHRQLGFPVFAKDIGTSPPQELLKVVSINQSLQHPTKYRNQTQTIHPGDILVADLNGVVRIPQGLVGDVVKLIPAQVEADEKMAEAIKGGMGFAEASRLFRGK